MKIPDVSSIAEEPELSQNETLTCESSPDDVFLSTSEENVTPINNDIEMTPVLFVNDSQGIFVFKIKLYKFIFFSCCITFRAMQKKLFVKMNVLLIRSYFKT